LAEGDIGPVPAPAADVERNLAELRAAGVLAIRDTGAHDDTAVRLSGADDGSLQVLACGRFLASPGNYFPGVYEGVDAADLAAAGLAELAAGATWVKLVADFPPGADVSRAPEPTYDLASVRALVEAVHEAGGRVAAHVTTGLVRDLVEIGIDSVEHGTALDEDTLTLMAKQGTAWTPTLTAVLWPAPPDAPADRIARQAERADRMRRLLPHAQDLGVTVLTGSDVVGTVAGELAHLVDIGLDPAAAIAAATTNARRFLGLPGLETGAAADLVTYADDPRDDPTVFARPAAVVRRGVRIA
jgi:imidazolonepropionase-like amidohydrolase